MITDWLNTADPWTVAVACVIGLFSWGAGRAAARAWWRHPRPAPAAPATRPCWPEQHLRMDTEYCAWCGARLLAPCGACHQLIATTLPYCPHCGGLAHPAAVATVAWLQRPHP